MEKLIVIIMLFCASTTMAVKPRWMHKVPKEGNPTYSFVPITVEALDLANGRKKSLDMLSLDRGLLNSLKIQYKSEDTTTGYSQVINGQFLENLETQTVEVTTFEGKPIQLQAQIIDEYLDIENHQFNTLYRVGIVDKPFFDYIEKTEQYGMHGLWRSAIVPGWGQFYKGSTLKGGLILGGTVALVGGIIFTENQRTDYVNKIAKTHDAEIKRSYATKRDHFATGRNICIGAVAALYVYNLVDAVVAPGARRVIVNQRPNGSGYAILPSISEDGNPVMTASITF